MVGKIIREYMGQGNKKLTVPGFGTFMRKDSGDIIFVDLIRKDDGVLRGLVEDSGHYSEVEAMAIVDRFIFEAKNGIEKNGSAAIEGFGTLFLDNKGLFQFDHSPQAAPAKENPASKPRTVKETVAARPADYANPAQRTAAPQRPARSASANTTQRSRPVNRGRKSKPDTLIIIAVIAAIIAILIMIFGLSSTGNLPFLN